MLRLLDLREDKDLTQKQVADYLKISRSQYSGIELETSKITHDKLISLAEFYDTSVDYILGLTNEIKPYKKEKNNLKLKELRKNKKLTGKEAGKIVSLSQQQYSSIEKNKCKITHDKLITFATYYETSVDYILGLTSEIKPYPKPPFTV